MKRRGFAFGSLLVLVLLLAVLAMTVASIATTQWVVVSQATTSDLLHSQADAVIASAIARIQNDNTYQDDVLKSLTGAPPQSEGRLTFKKASGEPYSTNNLAGKSAVEGWNKTVVPPHSVHLVGRGVQGDKQKVVEAIVFVPRYPYVVSSSGKVNSAGGLDVSAVDTLDALSAGVDFIAESDKRSGQLVANGQDSSGQKALTLEGVDTIVHGDVQSAASAEVKNGAKVTGQVRQGSEKAPLPKIDLTQYDPAGTAGLTSYSTGSLSDITLEGYARRAGDLRVTDGLKLNGGVLYVTGNLEVEGGISGTGAVIVLGSTTVTGGGLLASDSKMALLSQGPLSVQGSPTAKAEFRGIVYTESDFVAKNVNLVGSFVSNADDTTHKMDISNAKVVHVPGMNDLAFYLKGNSGSGGGAGSVTLAVSSGSGGSVSAVTDPNSGTVSGSSPGSFDGTLLFDPASNTILRDGSPISAAELQALDPAVAALLADMIGRANSVVSGITAADQTTLYPALGARSWALDLSRFVNLSDSLKVRLWREVV